MKDTIELIKFLTQQITRERINIANAEQDIHHARTNLEFLEEARRIRRLEVRREVEAVAQPITNAEALDPIAHGGRQRVVGRAEVRPTGVAAVTRNRECVEVQELDQRWLERQVAVPGDAVAFST